MIIYKLFAPLPPLHPLFPITFAYIVGICWQSAACGPYLLTLLVTIATTLAFLNTPGRKPLFLLLTALVISFCAGLGISSAQMKQFSEQAKIFKNSIDSIATVTDIRPSTHKNYRYAITAHIEKCYNPTTPTAWKAVSCNLIIYTQQVPSVLVDDRIYLHNTKISQSSRESWKKYALKNRIGGTLFCKNFTHTLISRPTWSFTRLFWTIRDSFAQRLLKKMSPSLAIYFSLLFLGAHHDKQNKSSALRTQFQIWGILHYLARSGLHLVICIMIWSLILLVIPLSYTRRELLLVLLSCIYYMLSWPTLSFVRAFTTYILYNIAKLFVRTPSTLHTITVVTLFFLIANPIHLFCLDFQLSFGLTFALAWAQNNSYLFKNYYTNP